MHKKAWCLWLFPLFLLVVQTHAQEVDCTVFVNYEGVATTNKELLHDFGADVRDYINTYKWGSEPLEEKVKCTMNIFISNVIGENRYSAQVFVGSSRQTFGTQKSSAVLRLFDETWEFTYVKNRPINHNPSTFNDLASFLDFYVYIVLGFDFDTYDNLGGSPLFQKAADIASLGRSSGQKGWQLTTGSFNRPQLIDEILNTKFEPVRSALYKYHFAGLDSLSLNPERAYGNILQAVESIGKAKRLVDPRNLFIKAFFETKYLELAELFASYPDQSVYITFGIIDPSHKTTYEEYRTKKNH